MGTALTERQLKELSRLTHKAWLCFDGDAAGEAATLRGMELAAAQGFDVRVVTLPPGRDPADLAGEFDELLGRPRATSPTACASRSSGRRTGRRHSSACARCFALRGLARAAGRGAARRRPARPAEGDPGRLRARARRRATGEICPRLLEEGFRLERDALAGRRRASRPARPARRALAGSLRRRAAPPRAGAPARARRAGRGAVRCWPSSTHARPPRGSTRRRPRSCCCACASAKSAASSRRPTSSARRSSRNSSRRSARPRTA